MIDIQRHALLSTCSAHFSSSHLKHTSHLCFSLSLVILKVKSVTHFHTIFFSSSSSLTKRKCWMFCDRMLLDLRCRCICVTILAFRLIFNTNRLWFKFNNRPFLVFTFHIALNAHIFSWWDFLCITININFAFVCVYALNKHFRYADMMYIFFFSFCSQSSISSFTVNIK